ncbi:MAG: hypothetical protein IPM13_02590 [Phycisphaerales bacterium]|nr:hypothetical protein [Phycisphaerales bacterium]
MCTTTTLTRLVFGLTLALCNRVARADSPDAVQQARLQKLQSAGLKAEIAILPVLVADRPSGEVATVLGLILEKGGLERLDAPEVTFAPPADTTWESLPAALGAFVREKQLQADYTLYAEYLGTPSTGPKEVRFVIVDREGQPVVADRQTPTDADFRRTAAADPDPMGCSVLVGQRVRKLLALPQPSGTVSDGKFARLWAEKSGTPTQAEQEAMKAAQRQFKQALKAAVKPAVVVLPTRVNGAADAERGQALAASLTQQLGWQARSTDSALDVQLAPTSNQLKRLWDLARALKSHLGQAPPEAEYVLLADYLIKPDGDVHGVHFVLCARDGQMVTAELANSVHDDFKHIDPKSADDCDRLVIKRLKALAP